MIKKLREIEREFNEQMCLSYVSAEWLIEMVEKQHSIIEENKRQQEVAVHQFRQAQKDIQYYSGERERHKQALEKIITNLHFAITVAQNELGVDAE